MSPALLKSATLVLMMSAGFLAWRLRVLTREHHGKGVSEIRFGF